MHHLLLLQQKKALLRNVCIKTLVLNLLVKKRRYSKLVLFYKIVRDIAPSYLQSHLFPKDERTYNTSTS